MTTNATDKIRSTIYSQPAIIMDSATKQVHYKLSHQINKSLDNQLYTKLNAIVAHKVRNQVEFNISI